MQRLNAGNRCFSDLVREAGAGRAARLTVEFDSRLLGLQEDGRRIAPQEPFAAVLGCADARVPIELVFNQGPNELFVVRVAGNSLGTESRRVAREVAFLDAGEVEQGSGRLLKPLATRLARELGE